MSLMKLPYEEGINFYPKWTKTMSLANVISSNKVVAFANSTKSDHGLAHFRLVGQGLSFTSTSN